MLKAAEAHDMKVREHMDSVSSAHNDVDKRHGECSIREQQVSDLLRDADSRMDLASIAEQKSRDEANKLITLNESIKADIEVQKDLYFKNKQILDNITALKLEVDAIKSKSDFDMSEVIKIRDSLDIAQAKIEKNSQEIIKRHDACTAREIQNKVTDQALKDRKSYLDSQEGKLNELKNNVNILMEKQKASASAVLPKEGA
jgi:hypothetical protein